MLNAKRKMLNAKRKTAGLAYLSVAVPPLF